MNRQTFKDEMLYTILCYGVLMLAIWALSSCSTTKVMSDVERDATHIENIHVATADTLVQTVSEKDSMEHTVIQVDSVRDVQSVIDSTVVNNIIETIITNTVNERGEVIGTNKETNRTTTRDHWRTENNNTDKISNREENTYAMQQLEVMIRQMHHEDSVNRIMDSLRNAATLREETEKLSWWDKVITIIQDFIISLLLLIIVLAASYYGYKYVLCK